MAGSLGKYERVFAAVAFAELQEHATALQLAGLSLKKRSKFANLFQYLQNLYAATAFTDLFCHDMALEILEGQNAGRVVSKSFSHFLEEIGLRGIRFHYIMARIP
jgi:hypothetical protein